MDTSRTRSKQWLADLSRLYDISQAFDSTLELPDLLRQILEAAVALSGAISAAIFLDGQENKSYSQIVDTKGSKLVFRPAAISQFPTAAALLVNPTDTAVFFQSAPSAGDSRFIPLVHKEECVGVLGVLDWPGDTEDWPRVAGLLVGLAGYAAIAIENAGLFQSALDRATELALLVDSSNAVSSSLDLGSVLNAISRQMMRALDAHWCLISGWDPTTAEIYRLAEYRHAAWKPGTGPPVSALHQPCHADLLDHPEHSIRLVYDSSPEDRHHCLSELGARRMLILPMHRHGQLAGLIEVADLRSGEPFSHVQIARCRRFAAEVASRLASPVADTIDGLFEGTRLLLGTLPANWCTIYVFDSDRAECRRLLSYGNGVWPEEIGPARAIEGLPTLRIVATEHRIAVMRATDEGLTPDERSLFDRVGPSALLALPLVFKGKAVGLVRLYDVDPTRHFSSREMALAHALANQAAIALENAHLVSDLQRSLAELKAMQSRLVHAARLSALGEMSTVIAHQINNPLTTVLGDAELLIQDIPQDNPAHDSAQAVLRAGQRAKQVVERMLTITRREEVPRELDLNDTVREAVALVGTQITSNRIDLTVDLAADLPPVRALPGQLEDVWMNLLINARDAVLKQMEIDSSLEGQITVATRLTEDTNVVMVSVADNGCGMPAGQLSQIFDPFYTTKPRGQGTGLGMYIVRQILGDHDGEIALKSEPGHGTLVTIFIPVARHSKENS